VADPPWPQKARGAHIRTGSGWNHDGATQSKPMVYPTMTIEEIASYPVSDLAAADSHLYLWTTSRFIADAFIVLKAWGFSYSTMLVWAKPYMGSGLGGSYRLSSEFILFGRRGSLPATARVDGNWFLWQRPFPLRHSGKPKEFFEMVEAVSPGPRLEMFARGSRPGWDVWGDEAVNPIEWAI
jgi:N6-adenosine-specific RNA methylase IME4